MFERKETNQINQTEFVEQVQFLEKRSAGLFNLKDLKKNKNLLPFMVLIVFIFIFILLLVLRVVLNKTNTEEEQISETEIETQSDPLNVRVNELKESLKEHNPTKQSLPFPQVDLEFNIN